MAVTGVGLQTSLYITLLLIFLPVISLCLFVALFLFHCRSHFLSVSSVFHLKSVSPFFFHWLLWPEAMLLCWRLSSFSRKKIYISAVFMSCSSSCNNIPPMLKGLDYSGVTSSAPSRLSLYKTLSGGGDINLCYSVNTCTCFCSDALRKYLTILTLMEGVGSEIWRWIKLWRCYWSNQTALQIAKLNLQFIDWFSFLPAVIGLGAFL